MRRTSRPRLLVAVLATTVLGVSACGGADDETGPERSEKSSRAQLSAYYDQDLDFGSCEGKAPSSVEAPYFVDPFECAQMQVPLDYDDPDGEKASIGVMRLPAKGDPEDRIGSLVLNPGGPGGSGMVQAALASVALKDTPLLQRFDIVGFDPRGVGASTPAISCFTDAQHDSGQNQTTLLGSAGSWTEDDTRALTERCAEGSGGERVLGAVGTRDVARDMDVLRGALGDDKLTFAGQSYGTRLGAVYAEMFPSKLRAMVLDGAIDASQGTAERRISLHRGFQRSFDLMAASCAKQPDCPLGEDPSRATRRFQELVRPLLSKPVPAGGGRTLGFNQATGGVVGGLYYSDQWPAIIAGLAQLAEQGRGDKLLAIGDVYGTRGPKGDWNNQLEANYAINCNDEQRRTPQQEADLRERIVEASPFLDPGQSFDGVSRDGCEDWPTEPTLGIPYAQHVKGLPPTLVVSVTGDPVTPYDGGKRLAKALGSSLLTVKGERHTVFQAGISPCVTGIVTSYLLRPEDEMADRRCTLG